MSGFLILTRRQGESILIGADITVTFLGYRAGQARIAIHAPDNVVIDREEVAKRKAAERGTP